jgi:ferritin
MMISKAMNKQINEQITYEFNASHMYLGMAIALETMGLKFMSKLFMEQSAEERDHALKFVKYLQDVGAEVSLGAVDQPKTEYASLREIGETALKAEKQVTDQINALVNTANSEKDHATHGFLMWFVDEQIEEISKFEDLLQLLDLAGDHPLHVEMRLAQQIGSK